MFEMNIPFLGAELRFSNFFLAEYIRHNFDLIISSMGNSKHTGSKQYSRHTCSRQSSISSGMSLSLTPTKRSRTRLGRHQGLNRIRCQGPEIPSKTILRSL